MTFSVQHSSAPPGASSHFLSPHALQKLGQHARPFLLRMPGHSIAADAGDATRPSSQRKTRARRAVCGIDSFRDETVRRALT